MRYFMDKKDRTLVVKLDGDLDHHLSQLIRIPIDEKIDKNGIDAVVFDFKNTGFMDSSGIGLIMGRYKLLSRKGGKVFVTNVSPAIKRIFEISGLYKIVCEK